MVEEWRDIPGFEGRYQVSDQGRVRALARRAERYGKDGALYSYTQKGGDKKLSSDKDGYLVLTLYAGNVGYPRKVHRLVAQAFLPNPADLPDVNHKDGVKANCAKSNLEWATHKANGEHAAANKLMARGEAHGLSKLCAVDIPVIRCLLDERVSMRLIGERFSVSPSTIFDIAHLNTWVDA